MDHPDHLLKCSLKMTAVLVLIFMNGLTSPVPRTCETTQSDNVILKLREEITCSLKELADTGLLSGGSCSSLNTTELAELKEQPLSRQNFSLFDCHVMKVSTVTIELKDRLERIGQHCRNAVDYLAGGDINRNCSLPHFAQDKDSFHFVRCLLELLYRLLSKTKL